MIVMYCTIEKDGESLSMVRIYYTGRRIDTIPAKVRPYCKSVT